MSLLNGNPIIFFALYFDKPIYIYFFLSARNYVSNMVTMCVVSISLSTGGRSVDKISLSLNALSRGELSRILVSQFYFKT